MIGIYRWAVQAATNLSFGKSMRLRLSKFGRYYRGTDNKRSKFISLSDVKITNTPVAIATFYEID